MAYLIECDRCGKTEPATAGASSLPSRWLQFHDLTLGDGRPDVMREPVKGGAFCERCVKDLRKWREPIPKAMPERAA